MLFWLAASIIWDECKHCDARWHKISKSQINTECSLYLKQRFLIAGKSTQTDETERAESTVMKSVTQCWNKPPTRSVQAELPPWHLSSGTTHGENDAYFSCHHWLGDRLHHFIFCFLFWLCSLHGLLFTVCCSCCISFMWDFRMKHIWHSCSFCWLNEQLKWKYAFWLFPFAHCFAISLP